MRERKKGSSEEELAKQSAREDMVGEEGRRSLVGRWGIRDLWGICNPKPWHLYLVPVSEGGFPLVLAFISQTPGNLPGFMSYPHPRDLPPSNLWPPGFVILTDEYANGIHLTFLFSETFFFFSLEKVSKGYVQSLILFQRKFPQGCKYLHIKRNDKTKHIP